MLESPKLLVVEDSIAVCRIVDKLLRQCGLTNIESVHSGLRALERLAAAKFDVVLCDWEMHPMDGLELLKNMRRRADLRDTPVILMSAKRDPHWIAEAMRLGASCMMTKPFDVTTLKQKLAQLGLLAETAQIDNTSLQYAPQAREPGSIESYHILDA